MRLRSKFIVLIFSAVLSTAMVAQDIPVPLTYTQIYDYLDELLTEGIILHQTAVRPYSRSQVAAMLVQAEKRDSLMNRRQKEDLAFYLDVFALERDTIPGAQRHVQYTDHQTFDLSLANIQFSYLTKNKLFKMSLEPILGMQIYGGKKGAIYKRWYGLDLKMDIAHHVSIWGSLRDQSYNGSWLRSTYYPTDNDKRYGAMLNKSVNRTEALNLIPGTQYKEANYGGDFSDSKGGISLYAWFGSLSLKREEVRWGDAYHASNIINNRAPAVPQFSIQLTPCEWFQFDYFHAWLVSNVLDSTRYYLENQTDGTQHKEYRPHNKFMAANMFTFIPIKYIQFSIGNSIVYAEDNVQAAYFIPIAFYKSLDHLLTKGVATQNQNSQVFGTITLRPVDHLKLYGSFYVDEFSAARLKKGSSSYGQHNPFSYVVGFDWGGWPIKGLSLKGEFCRTNIACYTHSIDVLDYTSNSYGLGQYMGDNAQSIFAELSYRPIRGMSLKLSYTNDTKYNSYPYLRVARSASGQKIEEESGIGFVISQKPFDTKIYRNEVVALDLVYEVHPNMYLTANVSYNNARGYDHLTGNLPCEDTGDAAYYLNRFSPLFYQGQNVTAAVGFSFGF